MGWGCAEKPHGRQVQSLLKGRVFWGGESRRAKRSLVDATEAADAA